MNYADFTWNPADTEINLSIILVTVGFLVWFFVSKSEKLYERLISRMGEQKAMIWRIYIQRYLGVLMFGVIPAIVLFTFTDATWADYGVAAIFPMETFWWILGLSPLLAYLTSISTKKPISLARYPEIRIKEWDRPLLYKSLLGWALYLIAYEWMFRGFFLYACARAFGIWPAILINACVYALVHVPKGQTEAVGAIPLGILLCIITFRTETIIVAVVVHIVMSWANELYSLKYHPEIGLKRK